RRRALFLVRERGEPAPDRGVLRIALVALRIDAGNDAGDGGVATEGDLERRRDFAQRGAGAGGLDGGGEQVATAAGGRGEGLQCFLDAGGTAGAADFGEAGDLLVADLGDIDLAEGDGRLGVEPVAIDADDDILAAIDAGLA